METLKSIVVGETSINVIKGDLTESDVDAIVNAANSYLQHGGGWPVPLLEKAAT